MAGQSRTSKVNVDDKAFLKSLQAAVGRLKIETAADLSRLGLDIQNRARELCPVDTGRLRSSIRAVDGKDATGVYVDVGTNVEYAPHVEFGTSRMPAQPYMRPALAEAVAAFGRRPRRGK